MIKLNMLFATFTALTITLAVPVLADATPVTANQASTLQNTVMSGLNFAASAKLAVSETYLMTGQWPESNEAIGFHTPADSPATITVGKQGIVTVTYTKPDALSGKSLVLTPSAGGKGIINWSCKTAGVPVKYLPVHCQKP